MSDDTIPPEPDETPMPPSEPPSEPPTPAGEAERLLEAGLSQAGESRRAPPASPEAIADQFPAFEVLEVLGQGGMGVVYKARQRKLDRLVALKVLPRELSEDPAFAERFAREGRTLARLQHPHIVGVHDIGEADGQYYLVMEYVDGVDLRALMRAGELTSREALSIVPQICDALQYAHDEGVVHRDIKPENVLLDRSGSVRVADFGLAKLVERTPADFTLTGTDQVMGTLHYMAPEQYKTPQDVDHRADIFSLGVVFYEMLTGELPLGRFDKPSIGTNLDTRIDAIVMRTLERERDQRYQRAHDVSTAVSTYAGEASEAEAETEAKPLRRAVSHAGAAARSIHEATKDPAGRRWSRWVLAAGIMFLASMALGGVAYAIVDEVGSRDHGRLYRGVVGWFTALGGFGVTFVLSIVAIILTQNYRTQIRGQWLSLGLLLLSLVAAVVSGVGIDHEVRTAQFWLRHRGEVWRDASGQPLIVRPDAPASAGSEVTVTGVPSDAARVKVHQQIEATWRRFTAVAAHRDLSRMDVSRHGLYAFEAMGTISTMKQGEFEAQREKRLLGAGFLGKNTVPYPLHNFEVELIEVGSFERKAQVTAVFRSPFLGRGRGSAVTLRFPMERGGDGWLFSVGPVVVSDN